MVKVKLSKCTRFVFIVALAAGLSASPARAADSSAPLTKQQVKALIKTASTPEDHMKLARYYRYEADKLKSEAKDHQEMEAEYDQDPSRHAVPKWPTLGVHCKDLAGYFTKAAEEAEQMASMHEEMAKTAGK
jgi:murein L,D-transpeptidase YcbB/YkuD